MGHVIGGGVRRLGSAEDRPELDPALRRDGLGFVLLALAVVVAAREWWGAPGTFGNVVHAVAAGTFGRVALAVPILLLVISWRILRHPENPHATARISVGFGLLVFAVCGLVHLYLGAPSPQTDGFALVRAAGGVIGYIAAVPAAAAITSWGSAALLGLLGFFSLLVITSTPFHQIPERLTHLYDLLTGNTREPHALDGPTEELPDPGTVRDRRRRKLKAGAADQSHLDGDDPYERAYDIEDTRRGRSRRRGGRAGENTDNQEIPSEPGNTERGRIDPAPAEALALRRATARRNSEEVLADEQPERSRRPRRRGPGTPAEVPGGGCCGHR